MRGIFFYAIILAENEQHINLKERIAEMGDTYGFTRIRRKEFFEGINRWDESDERLERTEIWKEISGDMDSDDFLYSVLGLNKRPLKYPNDKELEDYVANKHKIDETQCIPVTREMIESALRVFEELDKKVFSMPYRKDTENKLKTDCAGICMKRFCPTEDGIYVEDKVPRYDWEKKDEYVYYGVCKENVNIVKEVEKIYGHRYYHYIFPWDYNGNECYWKGSEDIQSSLKNVLKDMDMLKVLDGKEKLNEYVYVFDWI